MRLRNWIKMSLPIIIFLSIWQLVSISGIFNHKLFPPPTEVYKALWDWAYSGELLKDLTVSLWRMLLGFTLGGVFGVIIGMLTGRFNIFYITFVPIVQIFRPLPPVAIIPLIIVWFGIGDVAKVFAIAFAVFFPVWINTHIGASTIPKTYLWNAKILTNSRFKIFWKVLLPATIPSIVSGLRTSIAIAFIMVYVSEIAGSSNGLGYQISVSHLSYRIDRMMAALGVLAIVGASVDFLFNKLAYVVFPWLKLIDK